MWNSLLKHTLLPHQEDLSKSGVMYKDESDSYYVDSKHRIYYWQSILLKTLLLAGGWSSPAGEVVFCFPGRGDTNGTIILTKIQSTRLIDIHVADVLHRTPFFYPIPQASTYDPPVKKRT